MLSVTLVMPQYLSGCCCLSLFVGIVNVKSNMSFKRSLRHLKECTNKLRCSLVAVRIKYSVLVLVLSFEENTHINHLDISTYHLIIDCRLFRPEEHIKRW